MTTYVRAPEAARRLGVSTSTLYAYVSRGRIGRITGADGRASLFDVDEVEALREKSRRRPVQPPPTIDALITSSVTQLSEAGLSYRGHPVSDLVDEPFESVAELLWTGHLPADTEPWSQLARDGDIARSAEHEVTVFALLRMVASDDPDPAAEPTDVARHVLTSVPAWFGVDDRSAPLAERVTRIWVDDPSDDLVSTVNAALVLLADHELATSTLAVRVAASVRSSPRAAILAGLATVEGDLHGSASRHAHDLLLDVEARGAVEVLTDYRTSRQRVPGFGHSIYRRVDPRFEPLLDRVRRLPDPHGRLPAIDDLLRAAAPSLSQQPNIDLALAALTHVAGIPAAAPLFAIARMAGWIAHYTEELGERPLRYRGLARPVAGDATTRASALRSGTPSFA